MTPAAFSRPERCGRRESAPTVGAADLPAGPFRRSAPSETADAPPKSWCSDNSLRNRAAADVRYPAWNPPQISKFSI